MNTLTILAARYPEDVVVPRAPWSTSYPAWKLNGLRLTPKTIVKIAEDQDLWVIRDLITGESMRRIDQASAMALIGLLKPAMYINEINYILRERPELRVLVPGEYENVMFNLHKKGMHAFEFRDMCRNLDLNPVEAYGRYEVYASCKSDYRALAKMGIPLRDVFERRLSQSDKIHVADVKEMLDAILD